MCGKSPVSGGGGQVKRLHPASFDRIVDTVRFLWRVVEGAAGEDLCDEEAVKTVAWYSCFVRRRSTISNINFVVVILLCKFCSNVEPPVILSTFLYECFYFICNHVLPFYLFLASAPSGHLMWRALLFRTLAKYIPD